MTLSRFICVFSLALLMAFPARAQTRELVAPGAIPGALAVFGKDARVVVTGREGESRVPLMATAPLGKGRILVSGHESLIAASANSAENAAFLKEFLRNIKKSAAPGRVGLLEADYKSAFQAAGTGTVLLTLPNLALSGVDILYLNQAALDKDPKAVRTVRDWVKRGGGLIIAGPLWGWRAVTGKDPRTQHSGNQIIREAGIAFADGSVEPTGKNGGWLTDGVGLESAHALNALDALTQNAAQQKMRSTAELAQATTILTETMGALPLSGGTPTERQFAERLNALCDKYASDALPSKAHPVTAEMAFARLSAVRDKQVWETAPPEKIKAHPASATFPGRVPADAPPLTRTVTIDTAIPDWHSTGLYAAPGEVITISIPREAAGKGLGVRIGAHTDTLWGLAKWERFPEISFRKEIMGTTLCIASPFGGAIFVEVPEGGKAGKVAVTIVNAVAAPHFVRGQTDLMAWRDQIRNAPAPWAELEGRRIILSVPSYAVRTLDDPEALMAYWDEVADNCADLYAIPRERSRPERYCVDAQISAGYMHSGYPIMTWEDVARTFTDLSLLRGPDGLKTWGFYHELGHNHQKPEWTFEGTGEVTNNLFSLYGNEILNNAYAGGDYLHSHPAVRPDERKARLEKYLAGGAKFAQWREDPFLALTMYIQLRQAFGWEPFKKVFAEYNALPDAARPKDELQKRSQWMTRFSRTIGHNLAPFFTAWGIPTSAESQKEVEGLPSWLPEDWPKTR